jgi:TetR/AcrR family transcriptional repressor of nem operon
MALKEIIIHESQKLFSLNGYINTGINEIIKAAHTSKGGFYNYFSSKEELFHQVLAEAQATWREKVLFGTRELDSPFDKICLIFQNYRDRYLKDSEDFPGGCIFITFSVELDDQRPYLMSEVYKGFLGFVQLLSELLREGIEKGELSSDIDVEKVANYLFTSMLGTSVLYGVNKSNVDLERSIESILDYLKLLKV